MQRMNSQPYKTILRSEKCPSDSGVFVETAFSSDILIVVQCCLFSLALVMRASLMGSKYRAHEYPVCTIQEVNCLHISLTQNGIGVIKLNRLCDTCSRRPRKPHSDCPSTSPTSFDAMVCFTAAYSSTWCISSAPYSGDPPYHCPIWFFNMY